MSDSPSSVDEQRRTGYLLVAGGLVVALGGIAVFEYFGAPFPSHLGPLLPAAILILIGYRNVSASNAGDVVADERRKLLVLNAGHIAFWLLTAVILWDSLLHVTPDSAVRNSYIAISLGAFVVGLIAARFFPDYPLDAAG